MSAELRDLYPEGVRPWLQHVDACSSCRGFAAELVAGESPKCAEGLPIYTAALAWLEQRPEVAEQALRAARARIVHRVFSAGPAEIFGSRGRAREAGTE